MNIIFLGKPGAGKGTQCRILCKQFNFDYISTGDLIRLEVKGKTALGLRIKDIMQKGQLVDDETVIALVSKRLKTSKDALFDGFPRTVAQANALDLCVPIDLVIHLTITDAQAMKRLSHRWMVNLNNEQISFRSEKEAQEFATKHGGEVFHRKDDEPAVAKQRLKVYHAQTAPLIEFYKKQKKLIVVKGQESIEETSVLVFEAIRTVKKI